GNQLRHTRGQPPRRQNFRWSNFALAPAQLSFSILRQPLDERGLQVGRRGKLPDPPSIVEDIRRPVSTYHYDQIVRPTQGGQLTREGERTRGISDRVIDRPPVRSRLYPHQPGRRQPRPRQKESRARTPPVLPQGGCPQPHQGGERGTDRRQVVVVHDIQIEEDGHRQDTGHADRHPHQRLGGAHHADEGDGEQPDERPADQRLLDARDDLNP